MAPILYCVKLFSVLLDWIAKLSRKLRGTTIQRVMKGQDLNLNLCTESAVIGLKKMNSIHGFTLDGGFSR